MAALEAIERNEISKLPHGIFGRAFVRSYATEVGLDPDEIVHEFAEAFEGTSAGTEHPAPVPEAETNFENQQRMAGVLLKLIVVSLPIAAAILYLSTRHRTPDIADAPGTTVEEAVPPEPTSGAPAPASSPASSSPPASGGGSAAPVATRAGSPSSPVDGPVVAAGQTFALELHPTGPCWVTLTVDGTRVLARLMQAGEKEVRQVRQGAVIEVGDAGAFDFSIDGRPGRSLGGNGQVRTARITRETIAQFLR
jgi:cytoskeletal protein RodZ